MKDVFDPTELFSLIQLGESKNVEFKQDFDWSDSKKRLTYVKAIVGLHNHNGGYILFGIEDGTGRILGISDELDKIDNADINQVISEHFQPSLHDWKKRTVEIQGKKVGVIHIPKRTGILSVCKKDANGLTKSYLYYRYHSSTRLMEPGDIIAVMLELSKDKIFEQETKTRKINIRPFVIAAPAYASGNKLDIDVTNSSKNVAIIKKIEILSDPKSFQMFWNPPQDYGQTLDGGQAFRIIANTDMPAHMAPYKLKITFADMDGNLYYQESSKEIHGHPKHTQPFEL